MGGTNTYGYVGANPLVYVDPWGLAKCLYSISAHTLECVSNTADIEDFVGSHEERALGPDGVFSGVSACRNNPESSCQESKDFGPVKEGQYKMNEDLRAGHDKYWRLDPIPQVTWFDYYVLRKRSGFMLHPGSVSLGCITTDKGNDAAIAQYNALHSLLWRERGANTLEVRP